MSTTTTAPGAAGSGAAPAREQGAAASASRAGRARGSVLRPDNHVTVVFGDDRRHVTAAEPLATGIFSMGTSDNRLSALGECSATITEDVQIRLV